jgi:tRNA(fMet)-specific endonuclease VapC
VSVILDTSILVAAERGGVRLAPLLESLGEAPVAIAAITASELLYGCHIARDAGVRARRAAFVEALVEAIPVLPFGPPEVRRHADLWAEMARAGAAIGPHDLLIAATALAQGHGLATANRRDFSRVPGLRLVPVEQFLL